MSMSDSIFSETGKMFGALGRAVDAGVRGALLYGLIAAAVGLLVVAAPAIGAAFGAASVGAGLSLAGAALTSHAAVAAGLAWGGMVAAGAGAALALASFIPMPEETPSYASGHHVGNLGNAATLQPASSPALAQDNPYFQPGLGARLAERGGAMQQDRPRA
jgi:hypothetical protein